MGIINKTVTLQRRPMGMPVAADFKISEVELPALKKGEVLLKTLYCSLDPYMRGRMADAPSYAPSYALGDVIRGHAICRIEESKHPDFQEGDIVLSFTGWQTYAVLKPTLRSSMCRAPDELYKLPDGIKPSLFLGILGLPGLTAHHGLFNIGEPKPGETVVVAAATGPVGSMVGQLAKSAGCRVVGIAGGPEKCRYGVETLGFDACIDHKSKTFAKDLAAACPKGIDVYFENVGGPVLKAVFPLLNPFGRIPLCGAIHWYNDSSTLRERNFSIGQIFARLKAFVKLFFHFDQTPVLMLSALGKRLKIQGFIIADHFDEYEAFIQKALPLAKSGVFKYKEYIVEGIEKAPEAFVELLEGTGFGKVIIEV